MLYIHVLIDKTNKIPNDINKLSILVALFLTVLHFAGNKTLGIIKVY